jgi:hypothetical protein
MKREREREESERKRFSSWGSSWVKGDGRKKGEERRKKRKDAKMGLFGAREGGGRTRGEAEGEGDDWVTLVTGDFEAGVLLR